MVKSLIQAVGVVMTAMYEAYGLILTAMSGFPGAGIFQQWSLVAGFVIFCGFVIWIIVDLKQRIKKLTDEDAQRRRKIEEFQIEEAQARKDRGYGDYIEH